MVQMRIYESDTLDESPELENHRTTARDKIIQSKLIKGNSNNNAGDIIDRRLISLQGLRRAKKLDKRIFKR